MTDKHDPDEDESIGGAPSRETPGGSGDELARTEGRVFATLDESPDDDIDDGEDHVVDEDEIAGGVGWNDPASVFVLCARRPFEDWVRGVLGEGAEWRLADVRRCHAILAPELRTEDDADRWLQQNFAELFASQLEVWMTDEEAWPDLTFDTFRAWFDLVFAPTIDDLRDLDAEPGPPPRAVTCAPLSLREVLAEFLRLPPDGSLHVEVETGELFAWTDEELEAIQAGDASRAGVEPDDMRQLQEAFASESLVEIAHRADVDNLDAMAMFASSIESRTITNRLMGAIEGRKARRRFADAVAVAGLRHRWSQWLERAAAATLREFLTERGVPYVDDLESAEHGAHDKADNDV